MDGAADNIWQARPREAREWCEEALEEAAAAAAAAAARLPFSFVLPRRRRRCACA